MTEIKIPPYPQDLEYIHCIPCRKARPPPQKRSLLGITLNYI